MHSWHCPDNRLHIVGACRPCRSFLCLDASTILTHPLLGGSELVALANCQDDKFKHGQVHLLSRTPYKSEKVTWNQSEIVFQSFVRFHHLDRSFSWTLVVAVVSNWALETVKLSSRIMFSKEIYREFWVCNSDLAMQSLHFWEAFQTC